MDVEVWYGTVIVYHRAGGEGTKTYVPTTHTKLFIVIGLAAFLMLVAAGVAGFYFKRFPNPPLKRARLLLRDIPFEVELASRPMERARGLAGREGLARSAGMLFVFHSPGTHGFWMQGMNFPLDIVWIRGNRVVGFSENLEPPKGEIFPRSSYPPGPVDRVLEISAGLVSELGLAAGDPVSLFLDEPR
ncbi:DUF192 domain-containing protein [Candidatus Parcubacteria bacterium]|nr:MAG: DUF192 domain-containing protein [Candidatus Parcubacteria bacterium]